MSIDTIENIQDIAQEHLKHIKSLYIEHPNYLLEHYENERSNIDAYNGRQLLEMIQNADDAAQSVPEPKMGIFLTDSLLTIANTGQPFSVGGLNSILHSNLSPKYNQINQIGNKGLGFRSILSWADSVAIKSGKLQLEFSKKHSESLLAQIMSEKPIIESMIIDRYGKYVPAIAVLRCPCIIDMLDIQDEMLGYDTYIQIKLKNDVVSIVNAQLENTVDLELMLFLNNLQQIIIKTPFITKSYQREHLGISKLKISEVDSNNAVTSHLWNINLKKGIREGSKEINRDAKNYELCIAWQDGLKSSKGVLHSFFRTNVPFHFKGILHGTFELSSNRNELIDDPDGHNRFLFEQAAILIAETAVLISNNNRTIVNYNALDFAQIDFSSLTPFIKDTSFQLNLKEELKKKNIFPTISNKYINFEDKPVYYSNPIFAELLEPADFPHLLLCRNEEDELFLKSLAPFVYTINYLFSTIAKNSRNINHTNYARIIKALCNLIQNTQIEKLPPILYSDSNAILPSDKPVFIPDNAKNYSLRGEFGINFLNYDLATALKEVFATESFEGLSQKLNAFNVKAFCFNEIVGRIIEFYSTKFTVEDIYALNDSLFNLFKAESKINNVWQGESIRLVNSNDSIDNGSNLYFGKEYHCNITDKIYSYNRDKIVKPPKSFNIVESDFQLWKAYLKWVGVAELPRKLSINNSKEYAEYSMKCYDFKNPIDGHYFKNYTQFNQTLSTYGQIYALGVDDLDNILQENNSETIIAWLISDKDLLELLEKDKEPPTSVVQFYFYKKQYPRSLSGYNLPNYIRWKLSNSPWLRTRAKTKQPPNLCTSSVTITDEFSPIIDKPYIDYHSDIFQKNGIKSDKIDYLLNLIGVHKTISDFSTNTLYSILLKLPQIDPDGKKAKTLYREIALNYNEHQLDRDDEFYINFNSIGKVFCSKQNVNSYQSTKNVYYVNDKHYGASVINNFHSIHIDRRRGKSKIFKLFGVKSLEKLKFRMIGEPIFHPLNNVFEQDILNFKPYVYVFRQEVDTQGTEKHQIKDVKISLVSQIDITLLQENSELPIVLADFESIYFPETKTIFIKTPLLLDSLKKLQEDISFCSAIAEGFSALIDVDAQRQQIRELYSKPPYGRDDLLREEFGDNNLEKLIAARGKLGIINDPKRQFWNAFLKCFDLNKMDDNYLTDSTFLENIKTLFPAICNIFDDAFNQIDYENYNNEHSLRFILNIFQILNLTIDIFNKYAYPPLDITNIYELDFKIVKDANRLIFKNLLYIKFTSNEKDKSSFNDNMLAYESINPEHTNDLNYNVFNDLNIRTIEIFDIDLRSNYEIINFEELYDLNIKTYISKIGQEHISETLAYQFIKENPRIASLLYFNDEIDNVITELKAWAPKADANSNIPVSNINKKRICIGSNPFFYTDFKDLINQLDLTFSDEKLNIDISKIKIKKLDRNSIPKPRKGIGNITNKKPKKPKEEIGFLGEYIVYKYLLDSSNNKVNVKWVSEYAKEAGVNLDGADGKGYDIEYTPNNAEYPRYVEVKVIDWENAFHISSNEINCGEKLKKRYEIFLVKNISNLAEVSIEVIQGPFDYHGKESFTDNNLFTVINDSFILKYDIN